MNRLRLIVCAILASNLVAQAQAPKVWTLKMDEDKVMGQKILIGTTEARVSGPASPMYRLTLRCNGKGQTTTITAFTPAGEARQIPEWQTRVESGDLMLGMLNKVVSWLDLHYQIDDQPVQTTTLEQTESSNEGTAELLHSQSVLPQIFIGLPKRRLLVRDIFSKESVEFSFAELTPDERSTIQRMCFPGL